MKQIRQDQADGGKDSARGVRFLAWVTERRWIVTEVGWTGQETEE